MKRRRLLGGKGYVQPPLPEKELFSNYEIEQAFASIQMPTAESEFYNGMAKYMANREYSPFTIKHHTSPVKKGIAKIFNARNPKIEALNDVLNLFEVHHDRVSDSKECEPFFEGLVQAMHLIGKNMDSSRDYFRLAKYIPYNLCSSKEFVDAITKVYVQVTDKGVE